MERVTEEQIKAAKNMTTSSEYTRLLALRDEQRVEDSIRAASGCLLRDQGLGFNSGTPTECPVEDCSARFEKASLSIQGQSTCVDPLSMPQRKY